MATLSDLLVSYKQVNAPVASSSRISFELPSTKYQRMLDYLDNKTQTKSSTDSTDNEFKWEYTPSNTSSVAHPLSSTDKSYIYTDRNKWKSDMEAAYRKLGLNDNAIKNLIAKNALESRWGNAAQGHYNYGNITTGSSWKGDYVNGKDRDANGNSIASKFRSYKSMDDYVTDEIDFLTRLYDFNQNDDFNTFTRKLQGGNRAGRKYAVSPNYIKSMQKVYNGLK